MHTALVTLLLALATLTACQDDQPKSARILVYAPYVSRSVLERFRPLAEGMGDKGHQVYYVSPFHFDYEPKVTSIVIPDPVQGKNFVLFNAIKYNLVFSYSHNHHFGQDW